MPNPGDAAGEAAKVRRGLQLAMECLRRAMQDTLRADGIRWTDNLKQSISGPLYLSGHKSPHEALASRHSEAMGGLRSSFGFDVAGTQSLDGMTERKYTTSPYAMTHEFGATIVPVNAKMLAIPLPPAMTPSGLPRQPGPRSYPDLFVWRSKAGNLFLARNTLAGGPRGLDSEEPRRVRGGAKVPAKFGLELLFILKMSVTIPPRLRMRGFHEEDAPTRLADFEQFAQARLAAAFPGGG